MGLARAWGRALAAVALLPLLLGSPAAAADAAPPCPAPFAQTAPAELWRPCRGSPPQARIHDSASLIPPSLRPQLEPLVAQACNRGLELLLVTARAHRTFSLVDFAEQLWACGGERPERAVVVATRAGLHARVPWIEHRAMRRLARRELREAKGAEAQALLALTGHVLASHRARQRTVERLQLLAAVAALGLCLLLWRGLRRRAARLRA